MDQRSELMRGPFKTMLVYAAMLAVSGGIFHWLSLVGTTSVASAAGIVSKGSPREHSADIFHILLALLVVLVTSRLLSSLFRRLSQPPVIGEVIAGLLLGPSFLGLLSPELSAYILPIAIVPYLGVLAQIGVVLYMFMVGLELDTKTLRTSAHATLVISHASIIVPFLLGATAALWLYPTLAGPAVSFVVFAMFMGLSLSVTAFPVLARIVTDVGLQTNPLGAIALSCAAIDDVTAWRLLAALEGVAQARTGQALVTMLLTLGYVAFVLGAVRPLVRRLCARLEALGHVPPAAIALSIVGVLTSALVTDAIGIHALFGAFLLGSVIPHDSLLATELARRMKDLVLVLLLPAFFAFTGMRTRLDLISGVDAWLVCGLIVLIACAGKVGGSAIAARLSGLSWRDATGLGVLMNTRGLMELVVLNIGLEMKIISPTLFAMMVVMAIVTTLATSPALRLLLGAFPTASQQPADRLSVAAVETTSEAAGAST